MTGFDSYRIRERAEIARLVLVGAFLILVRDCPLGGGVAGVVGWGWSLFENCTVDASINCSRQVNKGTRWMPWHQESKKGVDGCDKPR